MNNVILVGRLTKEPELRKTQNGKSTCSFTLAVNRRKSVNGQQEADFIQCVAWERIAEILHDYARKGSRIGVEGRIQTRNYENRQGVRQYVTEVLVTNLELLDSKNNQQSQRKEQAQLEPQPQQYDQSNEYGIEIDANDLPF